jgi:hypothetical protein
MTTAAKVPSLDALMKRKGAKGLQTFLREMSAAYEAKYGYSWKYQGGVIRREGKSYFIDCDAGPVYVSTFDTAVRHMMDYLETGKPNDAMRRAGVRSQPLPVPQTRISTPTIALTGLEIQAIRDYRKTQDEYRQALAAADTAFANGCWSLGHLQTVEAAVEEHKKSELQLAIIFDNLARQAGVR